MKMMYFSSKCFFCASFKHVRNVFPMTDCFGKKLLLPLKETHSSFLLSAPHQILFSLLFLSELWMKAMSFLHQSLTHLFVLLSNSIFIHNAWLTWKKTHSYFFGSAGVRILYACTGKCVLLGDNSLCTLFWYLCLSDGFMSLWK